MTQVLFDRALIEKYNVSGPRYTSYPTVLQFDPAFNAVYYRRLAAGTLHRNFQGYSTHTVCGLVAMGMSAI